MITHDTVGARQLQGQRRTAKLPGCLCMLHTARLHRAAMASMDRNGKAGRVLSSSDEVTRKALLFMVMDGSDRISLVTLLLPTVTMMIPM